MLYPAELPGRAEEIVVYRTEMSEAGGRTTKIRENSRDRALL